MPLAAVRLAEARARLVRAPLLAVAFLLLLSAGVARAQEKAPPLAPPRAEPRPVKIEAHGETRIDPYAWLRDDERENPDVLAYLAAENAYAEALLAPWKPVEEAIAKEIVARIQEEDETVPARRGRHLYWERTEKGKQYPIHLRRRAQHPAEKAGEPPVEVVLDLNAEAEGKDFYAAQALEPSPDGRLLAYLEDATGDERFVLRVRDLATGALLGEGIEDVGDFAWATDGKTILYALQDEAHRPYKVLAHVVGTPTAGDRLLHEEADDQFWVSLYRTRSDRFLVIACGSQDTADARVLPADAPTSTPVLVRPRREGIEDEVDHHGDHLYVLTNEDAVNFKLIRAPLAAWSPKSDGAPAPPSWETVIPHRPATLLENVDFFERFRVAHERTDGVQQLRVLDLREGGGEHLVAFDEPCYSLRVGPNHVFEATTLRFEVSTLTTPPSVYDYDLAARTRALLKRHVAHGHDPAAYEARRIHATAADGTEVPISLVHRRGLAQDGRAPCYLIGYGAYGIPLDPYFSWTRVSLLERGFVVAIAHVRGGGELGRPWYDAGKLLKKKTTFSDFIACAEELVRRKYTSPDRLVATGGSAGGLLMGAVANLRPDLFRAIVADVPFVDVINTMSDPTIPLTVIEYDEWGNPADEVFYRYMRGYSPYDNVKAQAYPEMLVTSGLYDTRVGYWEPAKWVARLRATKTDDRALLLVTDMSSGHGGASGRYDAYAQYAREYGFVLRAVGWPPPAKGASGAGE